MRIFDAITRGITVGVARLLRALLRTYNTRLSTLRGEPVVPFGKCDRVARLRNNTSEIRLRELRAPLPMTSEEAPRRQIVQ
jgi:hypothetical protein